MNDPSTGEDQNTTSAERTIRPGKDLLQIGMATRRHVLGHAHVDRAEAAKSEFDEPFQTLITDVAWAQLWSRPHWSHRERSCVTIALMAALGHWEELAMHIRATANTGASREDIREALMHVAVYAGVPAANKAFKIAKATFAEMDNVSAETGGEEPQR